MVSYHAISLPKKETAEMMKKLNEILNEICAEAFLAAGYDRAYGKVNLSNRPDLCEYQCNGAMACAKAARKKPIEIAEAVVLKLRENEAFAKAEACMPGFINLELAPEFLASYLREMSKDRTSGEKKAFVKGGAEAYVPPALPRLGLSEAEVPQTIIVDYGGANVAKPLHVGHLRSAVIGEALKRMGARLGHHMIGDVHLGDWGLQMGLIIEELKDRGQTEFTLSDLEEIYPAASAKAKETDADGKLTEAASAFKERALKATGLLQSGDPECRRVWERIMELSLADLKKNYDNLNVHFELWKGESDAQQYIPAMIDELVKKGIAYRSQGALVVDVQEESDTKELPPCIIQKSDGASLYATTDLATMVEREKLYQPDAYIYVADQRQNLHYTSFFRVAKKGGIVREDERLSFLGFGTMNGKDGKPFKTREGGVMRLSILISDITEKVYEKIRETRSEAEIPEAEARKIAGIVGLAALKYGDLSNQAAKDYIFDLDRFVSFEGNTGPYILYTIVRITSILNKYFGTEQAEALAEKIEAAFAAGACGQAAESGAEGAEAAAEGLSVRPASGKTEKALALLLSRYGEVMETAWAELAPHKICQYIYEVSDAFNSFYHDTKILTEPEEAKRRGYIALLCLTRDVLLNCIDVLGFGAPERM